MSTPRPFVGRSWPYIHTGELADLLNEAAGRNAWDTRRVKRWLLRAKAATRVNGRWLTTRDQLRRAFPDMYDELLRRLPEDPEENESH